MYPQQHHHKTYTVVTAPSTEQPWQSLNPRIAHQILNLFDRDLEEVEKEYVFRSMKVGGEGFHYSKMARWAADTRKKLEQEVNVSVSVCRPLTGHWKRSIHNFYILASKGSY